MDPSTLKTITGTLIAGKYRVERTLGTGGFGVVYQAVHVEIGRRVAIKVMNLGLAQNEEYVARFKFEAKAAAMIAHPSIVDVIDVGTTQEGAPFIVMEYLEGETLSEKIRRERKLPPAVAVTILIEVLDALAAAHNAGIVHRDLKPANIFLCIRPKVATKLLDFGISKFQGLQESELTRAGVAMGTPTYMSPEQMRGAREVGPSTDLYAVGAILYKALSGKPPFHAASEVELTAKVLTEPHRPLIEVRPDLPHALSVVIDALLAKSPSDRPHTATETRNLLEASMGGDEDFTSILQASQSREDSQPRGSREWPAKNFTPVTPGKPPVPRDEGTEVYQPITLAAPSRKPSFTELKSIAVDLTASVPTPVISDSTDKPRKSKITSVALGGLMLLAISGGTAYWFSQRMALTSAPSTSTSAIVVTRPSDVSPPEKLVDPAPSPIEIKLLALPRQAQWTLDGEPLKGNPSQVSRPSGSTHLATVSAPGFQTHRFELTFDIPRTEQLSLNKERVGRPTSKLISPNPRTRKSKSKSNAGINDIDHRNPFNE